MLTHLNNKFKLTFLLSLTLLASGCASSMHVPEVADEPPNIIMENADVRPMAFHKGVVKINRGQQIGMMQIGLLCVPNSRGQITWKGGKIDFTDDEMIEIFRDELKKENFPVVGDTSALFEDVNKTSAELLVAALIKDIKMNVCYPMAGFGNFSDAKGEAYMEVEWQVYSSLDRKTVHKTVTKGGSKLESARSTGAQDILYDAFAQATRNLMADNKFHKLVLRDSYNSVLAKQDFKELELPVTRASSVSLSKKINDVRMSVVTIRAGTGHGSGVIIGKGNYVLTNYHVVGESKHVKLMTATGREILGEVIRKDSKRDIALILIEPTGIPGLPIKEKEPSISSAVYAIGSPLMESLSTTISKGIVSGYRSNNGLRYIQSDVTIQPGNSGGPLLDKYGNIVGIAVSGLTYNNSLAGINMFIPISDAISFLNIKLVSITPEKIYN